MKKLTALFLCLTIVLTIFGCSDKDNTSALIPISNNELQTKINEKSNYVLYIGRPTCPNCVDFQPTLEKVVKKHDLEVLYYNTDDAKAENEEAAYSILDNLQVGEVPALLVADGNQLRQLFGVHSEKDVVKFLKEHEAMK